MNFTMTERDYRNASDDSEGRCVECGADAFGVEPDACNYDCEACGAAEVFGLEELLMMGKITIAS